MNRQSNTRGEKAGITNSGWNATGASMPDVHYAELIEVIWACERAWNQEDRINADVKHGRS